MSIIHDALKKAQEDRKKGDRDAVHIPWEQKKLPGKYIYAVLVVVVVVVVGYLYIPSFHKQRMQVASSIQSQSKPFISPVAANKVLPVSSVTAKVPENKALAPQASQPAVSESAGNERRVADGQDLKKKNEAAGFAEKGKVELPQTKLNVPRKKEAAAANTAERQSAQSPPVSHNPPRQVSQRPTDKRDADVLYNKALGEQRSGRTVEAKIIYKQVLAENPGHVEALNNLGAMLLQEGDSAGASACFKSLLEYNKEYPKAYNNMGLALMKDGSASLAEEYFRKAITLDTKNVEPYMNLAALLRSQRKFQEAAKILETPLRWRNGQDEPSLYLAYAVIQDNMEEHTIALQYYRRYLVSSQSHNMKKEVLKRIAYLEGKGD